MEEGTAGPTELEELAARMKAGEPGTVLEFAGGRTAVQGKTSAVRTRGSLKPLCTFSGFSKFPRVRSYGYSLHFHPAAQKIKRACDNRP